MKLRNYGITKPLWSLTRQRSIITMVVLLAGIVGSTLGLTDNVQAAVGADYTTAQVKSTLNVIGKPSLFVRDIVLDHYEQYDQSQAFVSGYDSRGHALTFDQLDFEGTVSVSNRGTYIQIFSFTDPYTQERVSQTVFITVK
ncbi:hypothetical protein [Lacticaseibacillus paracasei]|uniref:hypothetical protein n=1 Tax=Lacticaseibacillus paracasei TaxID=1597 RepID=UPI0005B3C588|nr:hypothetical protein [Lacticaseibacillus paracasei]QPC19177.1 hypothetical protein LacP0734_01535 [Lacticaseibacillus paracasei subsp. tolerans]